MTRKKGSIKKKMKSEINIIAGLKSLHRLQSFVNQSLEPCPFSPAYPVATFPWQKNSQELQLHGVHIFLFQGDNQPLPLLLLHLWVPKKPTPRQKLSQHHFPKQTRELWVQGQGWTSVFFLKMKVLPALQGMVISWAEPLNWGMCITCGKATTCSLHIRGRCSMLVRALCLDKSGNWLGYMQIGTCHICLLYSRCINDIATFYSIVFNFPLTSPVTHMEGDPCS